MAAIIIGYDTNEGQREPVTLNSIDDLFYIECAANDYAHDVTNEQARILRGVDFQSKLDVIADVTLSRSAELWFEAA